MEPQRIPQVNGLAPIVGWTEASPTPAHSPQLIKSLINGSLPLIPGPGNEYDVSKRSPSNDSTFSAEISSIGNEPAFISNNNLLEDNINGSSPLLSDVDDNKNIIVPANLKDKSPPPILRRTSPPATVTYLTENPACEGVKFFGIPDKDSICSSDSYGEDSDDEEDKSDISPQIPDGGWGWIIVVASLILSMVADGISFSFGLLYVEFLNHFNESKSKTSWIGSLFMSVPLMSGPIMSALVDKYGCRKMTMLGGIISASGFVMAAFSNSVELLLLTFGVIAGLGLGLCYVTAVVSIAYWFDKKRSLAVSLGACGTGIGTFIYAPMTQYFIEEYGWRGTILMLAGTFLNMCVCGAVMRDPEWWILEQQKQSITSNKSTRGPSSCGSVSRLSGGAESNFPGLEELRSLMKSGETPEYILSTLVTSIVNDKDANTIENQKIKAVCNSVVNLPTFVKQSEKVPLEVLESLSSNKKLYNVILENYPSLLHCRSSSDNKLNGINNDQPITRIPVTMSMKLKTSKKTPKIQNVQSLDTNDDLTISPLLSPTGNKDVADNHQPSTKTNGLTPIIKPPKTQEPWLKRQFSVNQHYLKNIKVHRHSVMYRGAMMNISKYRLRASSCPNIYRNSMITLHQKDDDKWYTEMWDNVQSMFDFKMFFEFHFLLMSVGTLILFIWFIVPYFYLAEYMTRTNYSEDDAATMISVIGITNTIGMIFLGWAGDQPWMNVTKTYAVCLIFCGISTFFYPLVISNYWLMIVVSALFGLFFASSFSFTPIILVELIPLEKFTLAYGLILLMQGIGNLVGPPLAGFIFDLTQSWDLSFYLAGIFIMLSGLFVGAIPYTKNFRVIGEAPLERDLERISQLSQKDSISFIA